MNIDQPVFMVSMQGQFEEHFVPPPAGLPNPTGTVLSFTYDPTADQVVDLSVGNTVPALAQLGQVTAINP